MSYFRSFFLVSIKSLQNFSYFCKKYLYYKESEGTIKYDMKSEVISIGLSSKFSFWFIMWDRINFLLPLLRLILPFFLSLLLVIISMSEN